MKIYTKDNKESGTIKLPEQFSEDLRVDIIKKAFRVIMNNTRQPYGADPMAGKKSSAELSRRRRKYRGSYGFGISRVPRKVMSRRGTRLNWVGAFAPGTVGGRRAHPPKVEKDYSLKINKKEKKQAIRSAISATMDIESVKERGHIPPDKYPFAVADDFESISKTKDLKKTLEGLGLKDELERTSVKKIRAGRGTMRGRKYKTSRGPLFVVASKNCPLYQSASSIPGLEVTCVNTINVADLAPGAVPGRITLWSKSAIETINKEKLFAK